MAVEIERKFLLRDDGWRAHIVSSRALRQGYLSVDPPRTVRVRLVDDHQAFLTIKGSRVADRRPEFEYGVPAADARFMLDHLCRRPLIEKVRHHLDLESADWTVDEFSGDNAGLVLAEAELPEGRVLGQLPGWIGQDVTADDRYANAALQVTPFAEW
ncbi:MAG: CYTH domain-containing protein [Dactylosporangium sp.]|nr:CYTH domain-containing protein [Dactylosporangium sp.]NNJ60286.1 CYTH domain-containing protein [Dactylosporangium sp.]